MNTFENDNFKLTIDLDSDPINPRGNDNMFTIYCDHKRYDLGDKKDVKPPSYCYCWEQVKAFLIREKNAVIIEPIYMYDHSGITISTKPFSCKWDSGQIGFIYVSREKLLEEYNCKRITKKIRETAMQVLEAEIKEYDQYLTGDVYFFELLDKRTNEEDSCYGFFGSNIFENGMSDYLSDECIESLELKKSYKTV